MKKKMSLLAMTTAAMLLLGGCGTQMYALSEDEENLVIQYSAHILAKHNIEQKDGMTTASSEETQQETQESPQPETQQETQTAQDNSGTSGGGTDSTGETKTETISLAKAIGHASDLKVTYKGYTVKNLYQEGDYFAVTPQDGYKLVIMSFQIKNTGKKTIKLDTASKGNTFYACLDGSSQTEELVSLGVKSLSSYEGKIGAGQTKTAVLLFQVPKDQAKKIKGEQLFVKVNDTIYAVKYK